MCTVKTTQNGYANAQRYILIKILPEATVYFFLRKPLKTKVRSLQDDRCTILISFKIVAVFNTTSADIKTKSADVVLKTTTILKEIRIEQLSS